MKWKKMYVIVIILFLGFLAYESYMFYITKGNLELVLLDERHVADDGVKVEVRIDAVTVFNDTLSKMVPTFVVSKGIGSHQVMIYREDNETMSEFDLNLFFVEWLEVIICSNPDTILFKEYYYPQLYF